MFSGNWRRFEKPRTWQTWYELIYGTAEGFYLIGGGFSMKHRFWALWLRKSLSRLVQTRCRTGSRMYVNDVLSKDATEQKKSRKTFPVFEIEESEKTFDSACEKRFHVHKMSSKLLVLARTTLVSMRKSDDMLNLSGNGLAVRTRALKGLFTSIAPKFLDIFR